VLLHLPEGNISAGLIIGVAAMMFTSLETASATLSTLLGGVGLDHALQVFSSEAGGARGRAFSEGVMAFTTCDVVKFICGVSSVGRLLES
jgi:hypothetical protein